MNWSFIRHFSNYFASSLLVAALGVIALPVYTRLLSVSEYGVIGVFRAYAGIFAIVGTLYFQSGMNRFLFEDNLSEDELKKFLGSTFVCLGTLQAVYFLIFNVFAAPLSWLLALPSDLIRLLPFLSMALFMAIFWEQYYQAQKRSGIIAVVRLVQNYAAFALSLFLVFNLTEDKFLGPIWGQIIVGIITIAYFLWDLQPKIEWGLRIQDVKYLACFSLPLLPYALSGEILGQFSRLAINYLQGAGDAGLYSLGNSIGAMLNLVWVSLQSAWIPSYYARMNEGEYASRDRELTKIVHFFVFAACAGVLFGRDVGRILSAQSFHQALDIVPLIVLGQMYYGLFQIYALSINYAKSTHYLSLVVVSAGLINILLNLLMIPLYGYMGGAVAILISYLCLLLMGWYVSSRMIRVSAPDILMVAGPTIWIWPLVILTYALSAGEIDLIIQLMVKIGGLATLGMILFRRYA